MLQLIFFQNNLVYYSGLLISMDLAKIESPSRMI